MTKGERAIAPACGYLFKHPPVSWPDQTAREELEAIIAGDHAR